MEESDEQKDKQIEALTALVKDLEQRVQRLEREMSAIGKMEGAIKRIFRAGESGKED